MRLMTQCVRQVNGGAGGGRDGGGRAHRFTHKIGKIGQSLKCPHVKRLSPIGLIFRTHCNV